MYRRSWVQNRAPYTWTFFHIYLLYRNVCLKRRKLTKKPIFLKKGAGLGRSSEQRARLLFRRSEFESYCSVPFFLVKIFYKKIAGD